MAEDANLQGLIGSQGYGHGWFRTSDLSRVNSAQEKLIVGKYQRFAGF